MSSNGEQQAQGQADHNHSMPGACHFIAENSLADKLLMALSALALVLLLVAGIEWSRSSGNRDESNVRTGDISYNQ